MEDGRDGPASAFTLIVLDVDGPGVGGGDGDLANATKSCRPSMV